MTQKGAARTCKVNRSDHEGENMTKNRPSLVYMGDAQLNRILDKQALDDYLRKEREEPHADVQFLIGPRLLKKLRTIVHTLPKYERFIVKKRYWEDVPISEIAELLKQEEKQIKNDLNRILADLKGRILEKTRAQQVGSRREKVW